MKQHCLTLINYLKPMKKLSKIVIVLFGAFLFQCCTEPAQLRTDIQSLFSVVCHLAATMFGVASSLRQAKNKAPLCVMREHYF